MGATSVEYCRWDPGVTSGPVLKIPKCRICGGLRFRLRPRDAGHVCLSCNPYIPELVAEQIRLRQADLERGPVPTTDASRRKHG